MSVIFRLGVFLNVNYCSSVLIGLNLCYVHLCRLHILLMLMLCYVYVSCILCVMALMQSMRYMRKSERTLFFKSQNSNLEEKFIKFIIFYHIRPAILNFSKSKILTSDSDSTTKEERQKNEFTKILNVRKNIPGRT